MESIKVEEFGKFLDGGTIHYKDLMWNSYFEDHRIKTTTPGVIYDKHPNKPDAKVLEVELIKLIK